MGEIDEFKQVVRNSFKNAREHMDKLEQEIQENKQTIKEILEILKTLKSSSKELIPSKSTVENEISTGNKGAYSFTHSLIHSLTHTQNGQKDPEKLFQSLTNKEFLVFLTVFQLEKEKQVTYDDISQRLKLTLGCIRSYVSSLIKKGAPLTKTKINNKITILSVDKAFRTLTSEQKLINLYYSKDPNQQTLDY